MHPLAGSGGLWLRSWFWRKWWGGAMVVGCPPPPAPCASPVQWGLSRDHGEVSLDILNIQSCFL